MTAGVIVLVVGVVVAGLVWYRLLGYVRHFQQNAYDPLRFLRWVTFRSLADPAVWLAVVCRVIAGTGTSTSTLTDGTGFIDTVYVTGLGMSASSPPSVREIGAAVLFTLGALALTWIQPGHQKMWRPASAGPDSGTIALSLTPRARRIRRVSFGTAFVIQAIGQVPAMILLRSEVLEPYLYLALLFAVLPLVLLLGHVILGPYERGVQHTIDLDARDRVRELKPFIVGITGSQGARSTTAMLAHLLRVKAPTLAATGSTNTPMDITRHIREELLPAHQFMVVAMDASHAESIRRLCKLMPPSAGLITVVGDMHPERAGSTEAIRAVRELAQAVPEGGLLVANADSPGALRIAREAKGRRIFLYGETSTEDLEARLVRVDSTEKGTEFVLQTGERELTCVTLLPDREIILDLAGAFTMATAMGLDPDLLVASMKTLRPGDVATFGNDLPRVADEKVTDLFWKRS